MSTLATIRTKVRNVTGRPSDNQLSDADLDNYINDFLVYDFPSESRLFYNRVPYSFQLTPDTATYSIQDIKNEYMTFEQPAYIDGFEIRYFQDEEVFYQLFPCLKYSINFSTGTGLAATIYAGTFSYTPIEPTTMVISGVDAAGANVLATDDGTGGFVDETGAAIVGATINYETGAIAGIVFTGAVPLGDTIYASANIYVSGRPLAILYSNNEFRFYPVPDRAYTFSVMSYKNPTALLAGSSPELNIWTYPIVYGTAMKIFAENLDIDSYNKVLPLYKQQLALAERRTLQQLSTQRVSTIYSSGINLPTGFYTHPYG